MRALVFLLVLGNLLFYALSHGLFGRPDNPDASRVDQQIAAERIKLVSRGEAPQAKPGDTAVAPDPASETCLRWEGLTDQETERLEALILERFPALTVKRQTQSGEGGGWWVFIPALASKAEADKKAQELRQLGVSDYFILQEAGNHRHAISLGLFSSEKGGRERLADVRAKGVKSAQLATRPGKALKYSLEARGLLPEKSLLTEPALDLLPGAPASTCP